MRKQDIEVDGIYAWRASSWHNLEKVRVLELDAEEPDPHKSWRTLRGTKIRFLTADTGKKGKTRIIENNRQIEETWADYEMGKRQAEIDRAHWDTKREADHVFEKKMEEAYAGLLKYLALDGGGDTLDREAEYRGPRYQHGEPGTISIDAEAFTRVLAGLAEANDPDPDNRIVGCASKVIAAKTEYQETVAESEKIRAEKFKDEFGVEVA